MKDSPFVQDMKPEIRFFFLCQLRGRLKLEAAGMKGRGPAASTQARQEFGCKGNRAKILEQIQYLIDLAKDVKIYGGAGLYNCCHNAEPPNWTDFDGFEVAAVTWIPEHDCYEQVMDDEIHLAELWSVYGHLHEGGVECITDCHTQKQAEAVAELFWRKHGDTMQVAGAIREAREAPKH